MMDVHWRSQTIFWCQEKTTAGTTNNHNPIPAKMPSTIRQRRR